MWIQKLTNHRTTPLIIEEGFQSSRNDAWILCSSRPIPSCRMMSARYVCQTLTNYHSHFTLILSIKFITRCRPITGRNRTGPPCSVGRPNAHAPGGRPAALQTTDDDDDDRHQQPLLVCPLLQASNEVIISNTATQ